VCVTDNSFLNISRKLGNLSFEIILWVIIVGILLILPTVSIRITSSFEFSFKLSASIFVAFLISDVIIVVLGILFSLVMFCENLTLFPILYFNFEY